MDPTFRADHDYIDATTFSLLVQLQLQDLDHLARTAKGKSREGELTDAELARNIYREDLERVAAIASDQRMTESIAQAVELDGPKIVESLVAEEVSERDHNLARQLASGTKPSAQAPSASSAKGCNLDDETLDKLAALYVAVPSEHDLLIYGSDDDEPAESSSRAARTARASEPFFRQCVLCQENHKFFEVARAPCGHEYCRSCLQELFRLSVKDETLYPPRCCRQPFDLQNVRMFIPSELLREVEEKRREFETPNRTYCHAAACSSFIPAEHIMNDVATCPRCKKTTCITCKEPAHGGDCPRDTGLQKALELAAVKGWQRCARCWTVVELRDGCYHIT
jgi:IBR domain, a half RING-finger domain